jgi:hypothetical protein
MLEGKSNPSIDFLMAEDGAFIERLMTGASESWQTNGAG